MSDEGVQRILADFADSLQTRTAPLGQVGVVPDNAPVFHYTNATGLKGILESGCLWLTDRIHLNDPSELAYGMDFALKWCAEKTKQDARLKGRVRAKRDDPLIRFFFGALTTGLPKVMERQGFYVSSFSLDGDLLSQWCRYADDGHGYCLEFFPGYLNSGWKKTKGLVTFSILYDEDDIRRRQESCLADALKCLRSGDVQTAVSQATSPREFIVGLQELITSELLWNAIQFKHPAYADEREARVLMTGDLSGLQGSAFHKTRPRGRELVSYIELPFNPSLRDRGVLKRIRVGPAASVESVKSVKALLRSVGHPDVDVIQSKIPYRSR